MNQTAHSYTIYEIIRRNALLFPESTAVVWNDVTLTFSTYFQEVNVFAAFLSRQGIGKGDRVAVLAMNSLEYLLLYGACAALGAILVPINWRLSLDELSYILEDSGASLLFFDKTQAESADNLKQNKGFEGQLIALENWMEEKGEQQAVLEPISDTATFCLIYTAAVSGNPRGAALSHANIIASNIQTALTMGLGKEDAYLNMVPLFHITGMNLALTVMHMGGRNIVMEKFDADGVIAITESEGVTLMASFPPILTTLTERATKLDVFSMLKTLKHVVGIDSPDNIFQFTEKTGSRFWILYGQSETSGFVTLSDSSEVPGSAGCPCCISRVAVLDEQDRELPIGDSGEICVKGPIVFQGFWMGVDNDKMRRDNKDWIAINFDQGTIRNGWHHTGDVGRFDAAGYLWFEGRKPEKELIKPGGENVYPAEVEAVVLTHPDVEKCCVIGVPDSKFGEGVKAVCETRKGATLMEKELIDFVGDRIARYKKPGYVEFVDDLPKTSGGEIDRQEVKRIYG